MYNLFSSILIFFVGYFFVEWEKKLYFSKIIIQRRSKPYYKKRNNKSSIIAKMLYLEFKNDIPKFYWISNAVYNVICLIFILACGISFVTSKWNKEIFNFASSKLIVDSVILIWIQIKTKYGRSKI